MTYVQPPQTLGPLVRSVFVFADGRVEWHETRCSAWVVAIDGEVERLFNRTESHDGTGQRTHVYAEVEGKLNFVPFVVHANKRTT